MAVAKSDLFRSADAYIRKLSENASNVRAGWASVLLFCHFRNSL